MSLSSGKRNFAFENAMCFAFKANSSLESLFPDWRANFNFLMKLLSLIQVANSVKESVIVLTLAATVRAASCVFIWSKSKNIKRRQWLELQSCWKSMWRTACFGMMPCCNKPFPKRNKLGNEVQPSWLFSNSLKGSFERL